MLVRGSGAYKAVKPPLIISHSPNYFQFEMAFLSPLEMQNFWLISHGLFDKKTSDIQLPMKLTSTADNELGRREMVDPAATSRSISTGKAGPQCF